MKSESDNGYYVVIGSLKQREPSPYWTLFPTEQDFESFLEQADDDVLIWARGVTAQEAQDIWAIVTSPVGVLRTINADNSALIMGALTRGEEVSSYVVAAGSAALSGLFEAKAVARSRRNQ